ncbi:MAG: hypothetical protein F6K23_22220 [Okeania sp. SIO2C9]|nr:hypothetical protein [Okeania sp. SIO2C9]NEQ75525.1 hypothetical protein [Okeania sp. SIO2C9]
MMNNDGGIRSQLGEPSDWRHTGVRREEEGRRRKSRRKFVSFIKWT